MTQNQNTNNFQVLNEKIGTHKLIKLLNSKTNETVSVLPEKGGMLFSIVLNYNNAPLEILDRYQSEKELVENVTANYKGCNLFPFPNRIEAGKYPFNGKEHQLHVNFIDENNAIHGLIVEEAFQVIESVENSEFCSVKLSYSSDEFVGYPFKFEYSITYKLDKDGLTIENSALNKEASEKIPVGFGYHPYFKFDTKANNLILQFPSIASYDVGGKMIPTGTTQSFTQFNEPNAIDTFEFDTCYSFASEEAIAETKIISPELNGGISVWQKTGQNGLNFVQLYIPPERDSIAVEPMTCIANAFNNKVGLIELAPGESKSVTWGVKKI